MTWRLMYVRPQAEGRYHAQLAERGCQAYVPQEINWRGVGHKRQPSPKPLLPGYVFADLTDQQLASVAHLPDALYIVKQGDRPAIIPDGFIQKLREMEDRGDFDRTRKEVRQAKRKGKPLKAGEVFKLVRGVGGFTEGHVGEIIKALSSSRAEVALELFGRVHRVTMPFADMQVIETEAA